MKSSNEINITEYIKEQEEKLLDSLEPETDKQPNTNSIGDICNNTENIDEINNDNKMKIVEFVSSNDELIKSNSNKYKSHIQLLDKV